MVAENLQRRETLAQSNSNTPIAYYTSWGLKKCNHPCNMGRRAKSAHVLFFSSAHVYRSFGFPSMCSPQRQQHCWQSCRQCYMYLLLQQWRKNASWKIRECADKRKCSTFVRTHEKHTRLLPPGVLSQLVLVCGSPNTCVCLIKNGNFSITL